MVFNLMHFLFLEESDGGGGGGGGGCNFSHSVY